MQLTALLMAGLAQAFALLALPLRLVTPLVLYSAVIWICAFMLLAFVPAGMGLIILALLLALIAPLDRTRAAFFLMVAACLPGYYRAQMPFPGLDYLMFFSGYSVVSLIVLLPVFFLPFAPSHVRSLIGASLVTFVLYCGLQTWFAQDLTPALRALVEQIIIIIIPYFALTIVARATPNLDRLFDAVIVSAVVLAAVAIVSTIRSWDFYQIYRPASIFSIAQYRSGFLRVEGTASVSSLGVLCGFGIVFLQSAKDRLNISFLRLNFLRAVLVFAAFVTGSRGGFLALIIAFVLYYVLSIRRARTRTPLLLGAAVIAALGVIWLVTADTQSVDQEGTFDYRQELLTTSIAYIQTHFWFGDFNYIRAPEFAHLVQGQGIIDITNYYLQIALQYGMIGFFLYFGAFFAVLVRLVIWTFKDHPDEDRRRGAAILSCLAAWLFFISTSSDVGLTVHLGLICLAFGQGLLTSKPHADPATATEHVPAAPLRPAVSTLRP